jgi:hypothetical protein
LANFNYVVGTIRWPKVFDLVPNYNKDGLEWTFDFVPDKEALKLFQEVGIADKVKEKEGVKFLRFTQKEKRLNGEKNFPITVVDARNRPWDPKRDEQGKVTNAIGNDSTVEVKFKVVHYGPGKPTGVYPQAIRVLELKPFVRQEFAPLPEDNKYFQNFNDPVEEFGEGVEDGDPLEG